MIKRKGIILLFLLSSLFSFGGASNLQPEKKPSHHPLIEKLGYIPPPSDTPFNRTFASDEEKLKYGLFIEDFPIFEPMPSIESLYEKETIKRRLESSGTLIEKAGFFDFHQDTDMKSLYAYKYVMTNVRKSSSKFIAYPFAFDYTDNDANNYHYDQGGIFTLRPELLPAEGAYNYFQYLNDTTNVVLGKAKALYDISVAIFKIEDTLEGSRLDLFHDSDTYCTFFVNYIGKTSSCLYGKNEFIVYRNRNPNKGAVAFFNHTELLNNSLFNDDGTNAFGLLIIPDHVFGSEDIIINHFTSVGVDMIKTFVSQGGQILVGGKSGYLLEKMGLVPSGSYDASKFLLTTGESNGEVLLKGCEDTVGKTSENAEYMNQLICMNSQGKSYVTSSYPMRSYTGYTKILDIDVNTPNLKYKSLTGSIEDLEADATDFPFLLTKQQDKGRIFILNGNPLIKSAYTTVIFNILFSAMSKNVIFNSYINFGEEGEDDLPIPGGEAGILLEAVIEFLNLYNQPVKDLKLDLYVPVNVSFSNYDSTCEISNEIIEEHQNITSMNLKQHLKCRVDTLEGFGTYKQIIKLEILDQGVTQKATDIPLMYPLIKFTEVETGLETSLDDGPAKVEAALAAVLRATLNPDPSAFYPIPGRGAFADTVLNVENKENTLAHDVDYISVIPLVSPIVDGSDQGSTIELCELYMPYYTKHGFTFPWKVNGADEDYIDYQELSGINIVNVAEWDTPVKINKVLRSEVPEFDNSAIVDKEMDVENGNRTTMIDSNQKLLHQMYFIDSDVFYEHATQRAMPFIDTSTEAGAYALYGDNIPTDLQDKANPKKTRKLIPWSRVDIYFYSAEEYQQPTGMDHTFLLSLDKYPEPSQGPSTVLGKEEAGKPVKGHFDSTLDPPLVPNEYENVLKKYNFMTTYDPTKAEDYAKLKEISKGEFELTHYLMPVKDKTIKRAGSILNFEENADQLSGYYKEYPSVKFIYAHGIQVKVAPEISRQGGKLVLHLGNNQFDSSDPIADELITVSADQVAFNETRYDSSTNTVTMFFKRGLMSNEAYGKASNLEIDLENIKTKENFALTIELYEMKYDITNKANNYETYIKINSFPADYIAEYACYYSLPAVVLHNHMDREGNNTIREYELLNPYARYGIYFQELLKHRTIWASPEAHHVSDPGLQAINSGFATISNIGISSIPYVEYVTHGSGLLIPSAKETSRLEWRDIWGRKWSQPLRSLFPDVPPIPPPLRNFMMSTTFELFSKDGSERFYEWPSEEEAVIRVQMKFINNYPKFFMPTICPANNYPFMKKSMGAEGGMFYDTPEYERFTTPGDNYHVFFGHSSVYGKCYQDDKAYLSGRPITSAISDEMTKAMLCAATNDGQKIKECTEYLKQLNLPTMKRREGDGNEVWNYSPLVENYYPKGYIKDNMWDLTHYDYDDNAMDKGYKYHMDNNLPGIDIAGTAVVKPHNIVAFPIFKGFGYQMDYDSTFTIERFKPYHGWWSDNLQNKDHTLVAGQEKSNDVSVGKESLLKDTDWVNVNDLINTNNPNMPKSRLKTIYACLFNRYRVKYRYDQPIYSYPHNVYQNNVIPIKNELDTDSPEYTNYECTEPYQYSPVNISDFDNRIETPTDRDYLYFALNLRGGAKETINVLMTLKPFSDRQYEGITKVQDGARFTYWNPANGPNSFLVVDNVVNTVESYRVDYKVESSFYPGYMTTFNAVGYQVHTVSDPNENLRAYTMTTYMNSYGFGDSTVTVYVGGTKNTNCKLDPGEETYIKIAFYNNAGFDWHLKGDAITFNITGEEAISGYDLATGNLHTIQIPNEYKFLKLNIPPEIVKYINITASDHNADVAPQFFDFQTINVVSIRDSFEGSFFYKLKVLNDFPDIYKGRFWEIKVDIIKDYFQALPGYNDPTGIHDYTLKIPPIKFGVKYPESSEHSGKVFYTLGRGTDLKVNYQLYKEFKIDEIKYITRAEIAQMGVASGDTEHFKENLAAVWEQIPKPEKEIPYTVTAIPNSRYNLISVDVSDVYPQFPKEVMGQPDVTEFSIVSKTSASQLEFGYQPVLTRSYVNFTTPRNKTKVCMMDEPYNRYSSVKGAWVVMSFNSAVMTVDENGNYVQSIDQSVYATDSGIMQVNLTAKNTGSDDAHETNFTVFLAPDVSVITDSIDTNYEIETLDTGETKLTLNTNQGIGTREMYTESLLIEFSPSTRLRNLATTGSKTLIKKVSVAILQDENDPNTAVSQSIEVNYALSYRTTPRPTVDLTIDAQGTYYNPEYTLTAFPEPGTLSSGNQHLYSFYRKVETSTTLGNWIQLQDKQANKEITDAPLTEEETKSLLEYKVYYRVETYDGNTFVASSTYSVKETLTDEEQVTKTKSSNKFPIWAAVVIAILGILLLILLGLVIYKFISRKKNVVLQEDQFNKIEREKIGLPDEKMDHRSARSGTPIIKGEEIKVNRYIPNPNIEMSEL